MEVALEVIRRIGKSIEPEFRLTPEKTEVYEKLIRYFHGDPEFPWELNKGLMLMGPTGTGKTRALEIMAIYRGIDNITFMHNGQPYRLCYEISDVKHIVNCFISNSFDGIKAWLNKPVACIDDIGTEIAYARHYGNKIDVISYVLSERYTRRLLTFSTSNYPLAELEKKYDDRLISRFYAMFNFIAMKGEDFRKTNKNPR